MQKAKGRHVKQAGGKATPSKETVKILPYFHRDDSGEKVRGGECQNQPHRMKKYSRCQQVPTQPTPAKLGNNSKIHFSWLTSTVTRHEFHTNTMEVLLLFDTSQKLLRTSSIKLSRLSHNSSSSCRYQVAQLFYLPINQVSAEWKKIKTVYKTTRHLEL